MVNPVPKPNFPRRKPKRSSITKITKEVRKEVLERSGGYCERCGRNRNTVMEMAHLVNASQGGRGDDPTNIVLLCGPSVNTGTCHNYADYTAEGRAWKLGKRQELRIRYGLE